MKMFRFGSTDCCPNNQSLAVIKMQAYLRVSVGTEMFFNSGDGSAVLRYLSCNSAKDGNCQRLLQTCATAEGATSSQLLLPVHPDSETQLLTLSAAFPGS